MENFFLFQSNNGTAFACFGLKDELVMRHPINWEMLRVFTENHQGNFMQMMLSYDLKNSIEHLSSSNKDAIGFPEIAIVVAKSVYQFQTESWNLFHGTPSEEAEQFLAQMPTLKKTTPFQSLTSSLPKEKYLKRVASIKKHIISGDCYELNFCQEHLMEVPTDCDFFALYQQLNSATKAPFSVYFNWKNWVMLGASPERFLKKEGTRLLSQPIKGTRPRGKDVAADERLKLELQNDPKERAENTMIVDLVRNDLSKIALPGTVNVDEFCAIYTFETVHQMISSISCKLRPNISVDAIIQATFPMGSMTGAPKISAMELIEEHENFKRGLYSGSVGYILPNGDFDWNVVIRSVLVNKEKRLASCGVGGAITYLCEAENEWEECEVKINRILSSVHA